MIRVERIGMARIFTNLIDRTELIDSNESIALFGSTSVIINFRFFEMGHTELVIRHLLGEPRETWTPRRVPSVHRIDLGISRH